MDVHLCSADTDGNYILHVTQKFLRSNYKGIISLINSNLATHTKLRESEQLQNRMKNRCCKARAAYRKLNGGHKKTTFDKKMRSISLSIDDIQTLGNAANSQQSMTMSNTSFNDCEPQPETLVFLDRGFRIGNTNLRSIRTNNDIKIEEGVHNALSSEKCSDVGIPYSVVNNYSTMDVHLCSADTDGNYILLVTQKFLRSNYKGIVSLINSNLATHTKLRESEQLQNRITTRCRKARAAYKKLNGGNSRTKFDKKVRSISLSVDDIQTLGNVANSQQSTTMSNTTFSECELQPEILDTLDSGFRIDNAYLCSMKTNNDIKIEEGVPNALSSLETSNFLPKSLLFETLSGEGCVIPLDGLRSVRDCVPYRNMTSDPKREVLDVDMLNVCDNAMTSDEAYDEIEMRSPNLPIIECRNEINPQNNTKQPSDMIGRSYLSFREELHVIRDTDGNYILHVTQKFLRSNFKGIISLINSNLATHTQLRESEQLENRIITRCRTAKANYKKLNGGRERTKFDKKMRSISLSVDDIQTLGNAANSQLSKTTSNTSFSECELQPEILDTLDSGFRIDNANPCSIRTNNDIKIEEGVPNALSSLETSNFLPKSHMCETLSVEGCVTPLDGLRPVRDCVPYRNMTSDPKREVLDVDMLNVCDNVMTSDEAYDEIEMRSPNLPIIECRNEINPQNNTKQPSSMIGRSLSFREELHVIRDTDGNYILHVTQKFLRSNSKDIVSLINSNLATHTKLRESEQLQNRIKNRCCKARAAYKKLNGGHKKTKFDKKVSSFSLSVDDIQTLGKVAHSEQSMKTSNIYLKECEPQPEILDTLDIGFRIDNANLYSIRTNNDIKIEEGVPNALSSLETSNFLPKSLLCETLSVEGCVIPLDGLRSVRDCVPYRNMTSDPKREVLDVDMLNVCDNVMTSDEAYDEIEMRSPNSPIIESRNEINPQNNTKQPSDMIGRSYLSFREEIHVIRDTDGNYILHVTQKFLRSNSKGIVSLINSNLATHTQLRESEQLENRIITRCRLAKANYKKLNGGSSRTKFDKKVRSISLSVDDVQTLGNTAHSEQSMKTSNTNFKECEPKPEILDTLDSGFRMDNANLCSMKTNNDIKIEEGVPNALSSLETSNFLPKSHMCETLSVEGCVIPLDGLRPVRDCVPYRNMTSDPKREVLDVDILNVCDNVMTSDEAYDEIEMRSPNSPIIESRNEINPLNNIKQPSNMIGRSYLSIREELICELMVLMQSEYLLDRPIRVKVSVDGAMQANVSRVSNFVVISYCIVTDTSQRHTNQKVVAIVNCEETQDDLRTSLAPLFDEINELKSSGEITVCDKIIKLELMFGGDMIQLLPGLYSNISTTACPRCKVDEDVKLCKNPWHNKWGNNDTNLKYISQVPKTAQFTFQLLGYKPDGRKYSRTGANKFCATCITRATNLTVEEFKELEAQAKSNWKHETACETTNDPFNHPRALNHNNLSRKQSENAQIQAHLDKLDKMHISEDEKAKQVKQLRMLAFVNPGKFMDDFDPERSEREMKKMNRRLHKEKNLKKNQLYDEEGVFISSGKDLCDCLDVDCTGCHFPCPKCKSEKCGGECRCNRKWTYDYIESEGTGITYSANT